jgi:hypothetical protein
MPDWNNIEIALLKVLAECGGEARCKEATEKTIEIYPDLPEESKESKLRRSGDLRMPNFVRWARKEINPKRRIKWKQTRNMDYYFTRPHAPRN